MKNSLLALCSALLLTSCAGVRVVHTDVATGATDPRAIYVRPFDVSDCTFIGRHHSPGELPIRKSLAPAEFSETLKEQLEKIAPAMVLRPGDMPQTGWLVEGSLDLVDSGDPLVRAIPGNLFGAGASHIRIHVRIIDLSHRHVRVAGEKETAEAQTTAADSPEGPVIYEFDVAGGSRVTGKFGSITASGLGYAPMFDYQNASERIYEALATDEFRFGEHDGPNIR